MSQQIEIEFKNMLTKDEYQKLLLSFQIESDQIITQENHYFDTPDFRLKLLQSGLRIRSFENGSYECTLKERSSEHGHLETTDTIFKEDVEAIFSGDFSKAPNVLTRLQALQISIEELSCFGSLITDRVEIPYNGGTLVFDHSKYLQEEDYEVEYEAVDEENGSHIFNQFLQQYQIIKKPADKKIARFMNTLKRKGL